MQPNPYESSHEPAAPSITRRWFSRSAIVAGVVGIVLGMCVGFGAGYSFGLAEGLNLYSERVNERYGELLKGRD